MKGGKGHHPFLSIDRQQRMVHVNPLPLCCEPLMNVQIDCSIPLLELLNADPEPCALLNADGQIQACNPALTALYRAWGLQEATPLLPANRVELIQQAHQHPPIRDPIVTQFKEGCLLWQLITLPQLQGGAWLRGRDISEQIQRAHEAAQTHRLYRLIIDNTTDLISRHTPDGRFLDASPAAWQLLGYRPEQLRDTYLRPLLHPDDLPTMRQVQGILEQHGYHTLSYRLRHADGHYRWFETACRAIRDPQTQQVVELVSVSRDITARLQHEETRRRLAAVIEATTDLVFFIDPNGHLSYLNQAARRRLKVSEEPHQLQLSDFMEPRDQTQLLEVGLPTAERDGIWECDMRLHSIHAQSSLPVSLEVLAHNHGPTDSHYFSLVARDMTERELCESQNRRHQDELAHTARLVTLGELASGIAHEINQPLAAVVNYASASQRYLCNIAHNPQAVERIAQGLERITAHANHASEVIRRLRGFLRKGQRRIQALDVSQVAGEAVRLCAWEAERSQVRIQEYWPENLPSVWADRILLEQVLLNLLRNAIEANRERHMEQPSAVYLSARLEDNAQRLCICVEDQGNGVTEEEWSHLFTPFYTRKQEGLGLGLSISRSIIEGLGGELHAIRQPIGLRLECYLPILRTDSKP